MIVKKMKGWISPCIWLLWITWTVLYKLKQLSRAGSDWLQEAANTPQPAGLLQQLTRPRPMLGSCTTSAHHWLGFLFPHASATVPGRLWKFRAGLFLCLTDNVFVSGIWLIALVNACNLFRLLDQMILQKEISCAANECGNWELHKWQHTEMGS